MNEGKGTFEKNLQKAFESHEMPVRPGVWEGIQSQVAAQAATAGSAAAGSSAAGLGAMGKAAAVIGVAGLMTFATVTEIRYQQEMTRQEDAPASQPFNEAENAETATTDVYDLSASETPKEQGVNVNVSAENNIVMEASVPASLDEDSFDAEQASKASRTDGEAPQSVEGDLSGEITLPIATNDASSESRNGVSEAASTAAEESVSPSPSTNTEQNENASNHDSEVASTPSKPEPSVNEPRPEIHTGGVPEPAQEDPIPVSEVSFTHPAVARLTPNGDGSNDVFRIEGSSIDQFNIRIMSRAGQVVYKSTDPYFEWNGQDNMGSQVPAGVYFFEIIATDSSGIPYRGKNATGSITVY